MRRFLLFITLFFSIAFVTAQQVQWADYVVRSSGQFSKEGFFADNALGIPDAIPQNNPKLAWSPKKETSLSGEFLHVGFKHPMRIRQVAIAESANPGSIYKITLFFENGKKEKIYENKYPRAILAPNRLFNYSFPITEEPVKEVRIELKTKEVAGLNQIDAIAISNSNEPITLSTKSGTSLDRVTQLSKMINGPSEEYLPLLSPDGSAFYFVRKNHPRNRGGNNNDDIWVAYKRSSGDWSKAVNLGAPLNNKSKNAVIAVSPNNDILYLRNSYSPEGGVAYTVKKGRSWTTPKPLDIENFYNLNTSESYHLSLRGNILLMAIEQDNSFGDLDLYVSFKEGDRWTEPLNLGSTINTMDAENSVFLSADERTIYFASKGHEGLGGADMFMSKRLDESWTEWSNPVNLGNQINGPDDDSHYTFSASGEYAYYAQQSENGDSDIYQLRLPEDLLPNPVAFLKGQVIDATTKQPIKAKLKVQGLDQNEFKRELEAQENGDYQMVLPMGENIGLMAERDGYFSVSEAMELTDKNLEEEDKNLDMTAQKDGPIYTISAEAEQLRLRINKLDHELRKLEKKRQPKPYQPNQTSEKLREYQSDPELDALRHKYLNALRKETTIENPSYQEDNQREEDDELAAMKRKFNKHNNGSDEDELAPKGSTKRKKKSTSKKDDELAAMKRKFNKHNNRSNNDDNEDEYIDMEFGTGDVYDQEAYAEAHGVEYDVFQEKVWVKMEQAYEPLIRAYLKKELFNEVELEVEKKLKADMDADAKYRFKQQALAVNREIKKEYRSSQQQEKAFRNKGKEAIERSLWRELTPKVKKSLRSELKEVVKYEMLADLEYRFKKEEEAITKKKLRAQQKKEIKKEQKKTIDFTLTEKSPKAATTSKRKKDLEYQEIQKNILMIPVKEGQILPMNNIFFKANQARLKTASNAELRRVLTFLKRNKNLIVEVGGHTNGWCSHEFANELSADRAKVVARYFIDNGINARRIKFQGYGKKIPIATNDTTEGRKKNQRVELKILEIIH